jgi:hypothetical protein
MVEIVEVVAGDSAVERAAADLKGALETRDPRTFALAKLLFDASMLDAYRAALGDPLPWHPKMEAGEA